MQTMPSNILLNNVGHGTDLQSVSVNGSKNNNEFEPVLNGLLGESLNKHISGFTNSDSRNMQNGISDELSAVSSIIKKLSSALNNKSSKGAESLQLKNILNDDELSALMDFIKKSANGIVSGIMTGDLTGAEAEFSTNSPDFEMIDELISNLNNIIDKLHMISGRFTSDTANPSGGMAGSSDSLLAGLVSLKDKLLHARFSGTDRSSGMNGINRAEKNLMEKSGNAPERAEKGFQKDGLLINLLSSDKKQTHGTETESEKNIISLIEKKKIIKNLFLTGDKGIKKGNKNFFSPQDLQDKTTRNFSSSDTGKFSILDSKYANQIYIQKNSLNHSQSSGLIIKGLEQASGFLTENNITEDVSFAKLQPFIKKFNIADSQLEKKTRRHSKINNIMKSSGEFQQPFLKDTGASVAGRVAAKPQVNPSVMIDQISSRINSGLRHGETKIALQLHPPSLGRLNIDLSMKNNHLQAVIVAESGHAKHIIDANIDQLKAHLENHNIEVGKITVFADQGSRQFTSLDREQGGRKRKSMTLRSAVENVSPGLNEGNVSSVNMNLMGEGKDVLNLFA